MWRQLAWRFVLGTAEDEDAVVVAASFGTGRVPPPAQADRSVARWWVQCATVRQ